MSETTAQRWLHRYSILVAFATFILVIAGALVTSNDAALSIPSWPAPFHWPAAMGPGGRYELSHRVVAGTVSTLTIILALLLWRFEPRRWVRRMGAIAVLTVIAQAILGGVTVLLDLPTVTSVGHACLGQIFFGVMVSLVLFTRRDFTWDEPKANDLASPPLRKLAAATTALIFIQLVLGAAFRHHGFSIVPHLVGAGLVTISVLWTLLRVHSGFDDQPRLKRPAGLLAVLLVAQVALGIGAYWELWTNRDAPQPLPPVVDVTTAHVALGALVLATSVVLTIQAYRFIAAPDASVRLPIASMPEKAVI
ncbi:MAG: COX15/CtaA family protein [Terriglobia bacterium]|jgi:cytochrome c oxidase assembly protein subunit 15